MIPSKASDAVMRELAAVLSRMGNASEVHEVLYALLTARERDKIALRWKLVGLLEQGVPQRTIATELVISLCKITRGSHELKYGPEGFRKAVRRAVKQKKAGVRE